MIDEHLFSAIYSYCEKVSEPEDEILYQLYRETHLKTLAPRMLSGHIQGKFLTLFSTLISPRRILEIGTFTGYAAICMAEGLTNDGHMYTIEVNPELNHISDKYFRKAGIREKITSLVGDARKIIPTIDDQFDMIFIDAKKQDYLIYYDLIIDKIRPGGFILADNVLWDGKVFSDTKDKTTVILQEFNQKVKDDPRVISLLLPLRDGVMILKRV